MNPENTNWTPDASTKDQKPILNWLPLRNRLKKVKKFNLAFLLIYLGLLFPMNAQMEVAITGSVDTSHKEIKAVLDHWLGYLSSKPDSVYENEYWHPAERKSYLNAGMPTFDLGGMLMYQQLGAAYYFKQFKPHILAVEKLSAFEEEVFSIKTLFYSATMADDPLYAKWNPLHITNYFCVKEGDRYYLKNAWPYVTSYWNTYQVGFIEYIVHPQLQFHEADAKKALLFCKEIAAKYNLELPESIRYIVAPNKAEAGKLYGFDYSLSPISGMTHAPLNHINLSTPNFSHYHELIHVLFYALDKGAKKGRPMIIGEGCATYFGGSFGAGNFAEQLYAFSLEIQEHTSLTLADIISRKYTHPRDNDPIYITGGFIFSLVFDKHKEAGVLKLFNCGRKKEEFEQTIEDLFEMPYSTFNTWILEELRNVASK